MPDIGIPVNVEILKWAREKSCLGLEEIIARANISDLKERGKKTGISAVDRLLSWESGETKPTLNQLESLAKAYCRPVITFFLSKPPIETEPIEDFRTIESKEQGKSPEFSALLRFIRSIHKTLKEIALIKGDKQKAYVGICKNHSNVLDIVETIRTVLGINRDDQANQRREDDLFKYIRDRIQEAGAYVLIIGDLGSFHTTISPEMYRGLAIADSLVPLICLNPNDTKTAQLFSLLHEIAHLFLGETGISNTLNSSSYISNSHQNLEIICNKVAGEFLVPGIELREAFSEIVNLNVKTQIKILADDFKVSETVIALKMRNEGLIDNDICSTILQEQRVLWQDRKKRLKERDGAPSRNIMDKYRLSYKLINTMMQSVYEGYITERDASRLLKIPYRRLEKIL